MTQTLAITVNAALALAIVGALALILRHAHRPPASPLLETVHPSKPLELAIVHTPEPDELARAA